MLNPGARRFNAPPRPVGYCTYLMNKQLLSRAYLLSPYAAKRAFWSRPGNSVRLPFNGFSVLPRRPVAATPPLPDAKLQSVPNRPSGHGPVTACAFHLTGPRSSSAPRRCKNSQSPSLRQGERESVETTDNQHHPSAYSSIVLTFICEAGDVVD